MRPEWALLGMCTTIPVVELARCPVGELLAMRASQLWGNATSIPLRRFLPLISSSPPNDTWWELVEQWIAGTHAALEIVTPFDAGAFVLPFDLVAAGLFVSAAPFELGAVAPGAVAPADGAEAPPTPPPAPVDAADPAGTRASTANAAQAKQHVISAARRK
jgi:hypothetical protein